MYRFSDTQIQRNAQLGNDADLDLDVDTDMV